jgi:hypothetical protein
MSRKPFVPFQKEHSVANELQFVYLVFIIVLDDLSCPWIGHLSALLPRHAICPVIMLQTLNMSTSPQIMSTNAPNNDVHHMFFRVTGYQERSDRHCLTCPNSC